MSFFVCVVAWSFFAVADEVINFGLTLSYKCYKTLLYPGFGGLANFPMTFDSRALSWSNF